MKAIEQGAPQAPKTNGFGAAVETPHKQSLQGGDFQQDGSQRDQLREELRAQRESLTREVAEKLEATLERIKSMSQTMLTEIETFMTTSEHVIHDYETVLASQQSEAERLTSMEPDVAGATERFLASQELQNLVTPDGSANLSGDKTF